MLDPATAEQNQWVDVTWMPHSSLSQASHVTIKISEVGLKKECVVRVGVVLGVMGNNDINTIPAQTSASVKQFGQVLQLPIRWRDLTRDASLNFEILGPGRIVLYEAAYSLFDMYGRLKTGLQRIILCGEAHVESEDRVWSAQHTLYQLDHLSQKPRFGQVQSVPWLDAITRKHCHDVIQEAKKEQQQRNVRKARSLISFLC